MPGNIMSHTVIEQSLDVQTNYTQVKKQKALAKKILNNLITLDHSLEKTQRKSRTTQNTYQVRKMPEYLILISLLSQWTKRLPVI